MRVGRTGNRSRDREEKEMAITYSGRASEEMAKAAQTSAEAVHGGYGETWGDPNGRKHRRYTVRSLGPSQGFGILDVSRSFFVVHPFPDRESAWDYLRGN